MLQENQIIKMPGGELAEVLLVNECRARVRSLSKRTNNFTTALGDTVQFTSPGREIDISPNSDVEVVGMAKPKGRKAANECMA